MIQFHIPKMSCSGCATSVTKAVKAIDANADVSVDLTTKLVTVQSDAAPASLVAALGDAGYPAEQR